MIWRIAALLSCALSALSCNAPRKPPLRLSDTGLYSDTARKILAPGVEQFEPMYPLWSDGAEKRRFILLPPGTRIDTRDMDHWIFPVGTRVWKEFRAQGRLLETRFIERTGAGANDYWMGAFVWDAEGREAVFESEGAHNVQGTDHDVPEARRCASCHGSEPGKILGFSAVQLGREGREFALPSGSAQARKALGYLHANCGHCHSESGLAFRDVDLVLRLDFLATVEASNTYRTAVAKAMTRPLGGSPLRISPGHPQESGLIARMRTREPNRQMPPLGSEHVDHAGSAAVAAWIEELER